MPKPRASRPSAITFAQVCEIALALPGVEEGTSYGTPALKVRGKFLTRLREEDGSIVLKVGTMEERDYLIATLPDVFFITEHYRDYPAVLVRLETVHPAMLSVLIADAWRRVAPKRLVAEFDARESDPGAGSR